MNPLHEFSTEIVRPFLRGLVPFGPGIVFFMILAAFLFSLGGTMAFIPALLLCVAIAVGSVLIVLIFFALAALGMYLEEKLFPND